MLKYCFSFFLMLLALFSQLKAEDGYRLWLRYNPIENPKLLGDYRNIFQSVKLLGVIAIMLSIR